MPRISSRCQRDQACRNTELTYVVGRAVELNTVGSDTNHPEKGIVKADCGRCLGDLRCKRDLEVKGLDLGFVGGRLSRPVVWWAAVPARDDQIRYILHVSDRGSP